jgi:magnesium chelatase family protein
VVAARHIQEARFANRKKIYCNAQMGPRDIKQFCQLDKDSQDLLEKAMQRLHLSARAYHRIIKISRTIADLAKTVTIQKNHVAEAVQYRRQEPTGR